MHYCYFAHYLVNIIMDLARTIKIICTFMYTKRDKMHLLLFKHTLIRSKYKVNGSSPHFHIPGIYNTASYKWNNNENTSKIPQHIPWFWNNQSNIFTPSYKCVIYEVLTCDILTRLSLRIACSDFSEFMVTYHMTIFGKLLTLSKS